MAVKTNRVQRQTHRIKQVYEKSAFSPLSHTSALALKLPVSQGTDRQSSILVTVSGSWYINTQRCTHGQNIPTLLSHSAAPRRDNPTPQPQGFSSGSGVFSQDITSGCNNSSWLVLVNLQRESEELLTSAHRHYTLGWQDKERLWASKSVTRTSVSPDPYLRHSEPV